MWSFVHISVIYEDICFKFGMRIDIDQGLNHTGVTVTQNPAFANMPDDRRSPSSIWVFCHISVKNKGISMKFGTQIDIAHRG